MAFQQFNQVGQRNTPNLIAAQVADDRADAEARERKTRMMGQLAKGGAGLYNEAMGDSSPIADYLGLTEPTGEFAGAVGDYAMPELATSGVNTGALSEALRAPDLAGELGALGAAPEAGMNLASLAAPEAAAGGLEALGGLGALGGAATPTAGLNAATIGGALAPAAAEVGLGAAGATAAGTALPPLGIAMALGSLFGLF